MNRYDLKKFLRLKKKVLSAKQDKKTDKWIVNSCNEKNEHVEEIFEFLIVASGLHGLPKIPDFENIQSFKGEILHSSQFRLNDEKLRSKKVLVIGSSFSACDLASHLVDHPSQVVSIFRRPYFVSKRLLNFKVGENEYKIKPIDCCLHTRAFLEVYESKEKRALFYNNLFPQQTQCDKNDPFYIDVYSDDFTKVAINDFYMDHIKNGN